MQKHLDELARRRLAAMAMGGAEKIGKQHAKGKLTARQRVDLLLDPGSFQEYGLLASHYGQKPSKPITPADGLVAGIGRIEGRPVCMYAEDATVRGGTVGPINGLKRMRMLGIASQERIPLIILVDGGGYRVQSAMESPEGVPPIGHFLAYARQSGCAPMLALVMGPCAGEPALDATLMEHCIMVRGTGMLAAGGPPVVKAATGQEVSKEELGGAAVHAEATGTVDHCVEDDYEALALARRYLSFLPTNAWSYPPSVPPGEARPGAVERILRILPESSREAYDMHDVIDCIVDEGSFLETKRDYGKALITGFGRLNGHSVGVLASQPMVRAGSIAAAEGQKARRFIELCGAYHVPIVSLADTPGVMTGPAAEREGSLKFGLAAAYALAWAQVPVFSVILRKAFGFAGCLMAGSHGPQTIALAWPTMESSSLPAESSIQAAHARELSESADRDARYRELLEQYSTSGGPYAAAGIMNIDDVIDPRETRRRLIQALEISIARRLASPSPSQRQGVMP